MREAGREGEGEAAAGQTVAGQAGAGHAVEAPRAVTTGASTARIAYLVNQYPKGSHTFIRREIVGLEARGVPVERFSIRSLEGRLVDARDLEERRRTCVLLEQGLPAILAATAACALARPLAFARALGLAVRVGWRSDRGLLLHLVYLAEACLLRRELRARGVEHVHAHFGTNPATVAMLCHALGGPPFSFTAHGPEEFDKPDLLALADKIRRAEFVAGVSSFGRSQLYRRCAPEDWRKVQVVHCGVDASFLEAPHVPAPRAPRLVCVGRLCEQKGQLLLVEAAARLVREGVDLRLVLVGDGELRQPIEARLRREGLERHVEITGWASGERVREELQAARAMVLPSFAEGLPVGVMEALALGRPVISTYVAGIPELVTPDCGWLVPAGSVDALVEAMREALLAAPSTLDAMGRAGRERVRARHDAERIAVRLGDLFRDCVARERGRRSSDPTEGGGAAPAREAGAPPARAAA
ncbi:MAG: glycosyltransferase family 4 protein [Planctomycetes bacterium]|nr:glycosyltransferase family 4 protein [Planctomycetota bacterium]